MPYKSAWAAYNAYIGPYNIPTSLSMSIKAVAYLWLEYWGGGGLWNLANDDK